MIKIALPKGRFMKDLNTLFQVSGFKPDGYDTSNRSYRPLSPDNPEIFMKIFQEKDIPLQVAVGNYDLGICGSDWIDELLARFQSASIIRGKKLGFTKGNLYAAVSLQNKWQDMVNGNKGIRLASEYPNLTESFAMKTHFSKFSVFPLWGSSEVYPPESADIVILPADSEKELLINGLKALNKVLKIEAFLIANSKSWAEKDLSAFLQVFSRDNIALQSPNQIENIKIKSEIGELLQRKSPSNSSGKNSFTDDMLRLALPDGHQQKGALALLDKAGLSVPEYRQPLLNRRVSLPIKGIVAKVIRPQDMPSQVAIGNFDMAITGQDWLKEHLTAFPSSPVREIAKLGVGKVHIVAAVDGNLKKKNGSLIENLLNNGKHRDIRVASEYTNIAECYAREKHLNPYKVIPTWGASESFLPEDADLLIENIETGKTLQEHGLVVLDVLFESQACLIGSEGLLSSKKAGRAGKLIERLIEASKN